MIENMKTTFALLLFSLGYNFIAAILAFQTMQNVFGVELGDSAVITLFVQVIAFGILFANAFYYRFTPLVHVVRKWISDILYVLTMTVVYILVLMATVGM